MEYNLESAEAKYAQVASLMEAGETGQSQRSYAEQSIAVVRRLTLAIGIPQGLRDLDIPESAIEDMAEMAMTVARPIANNPREMTKEAAIRIYEEAY
jgi:alcohol dehydrogenase